ncbi:MAG: hypothetical protein UT64_C0037G0003 [Candidatus Falkowbacteria bacterium GW2011_GWF2_39_8]|uniref:Uncharacterized protein n=1 Tax=Candidatus Falkowbacteria bacterium GW2011_GWF2_39_8 TaxID=1618642 RepID=A0A0G0PVW5_9BACT|nr:MAG: hypothetical protein UT64_C0037G0003 [Candidatus Falkowbacteria bacterium GW2011_GWF2_39_8]
MKIKKILPNLALLVVLLVSATSFSWQQCVPSACNDSDNICSSSGPCVNETTTEHIAERLSILNTTIPNQQTGIFLLGAIVLFSIRKGCLFGLVRLLASRQKIKIKNHSHSLARLNTYLLDLFSNGVLHPKTYLLAI